MIVSLGWQDVSLRRCSPVVMTLESVLRTQFACAPERGEQSALVALVSTHQRLFRLFFRATGLLATQTERAVEAELKRS
jgi:hypothetical protein